MEGSKDRGWLGELRWRGYPHIGGPEPAPAPAKPAAPEAPAGQRGDPRLEALARENEVLRAKLESLARLAGEFERRLAEAGAAYESAMMESESKLRDAALERERLSGELEAARGECARFEARDAARESELRLERERRADAEKQALDARRRLETALGELDAAREESAARAGALDELRRQADSRSERLLQAKALTDQDVHLLRQEMREFLAKFHRIKETLGDVE